MAAFSLALEGPELVRDSLHRASLATLGALLYIVYASTYVGYGLWGFLLNRYSTAAVAPFTLLVPVVAFLSSAYFFGESLPGWKVGASLLVIAGIAFNLLEKPFRRATGRGPLSKSAAQKDSGEQHG